MNAQQIEAIAKVVGDKAAAKIVKELKKVPTTTKSRKPRVTIDSRTMHFLTKTKNGITVGDLVKKLAKEFPGHPKLEKTTYRRLNGYLKRTHNVTVTSKKVGKRTLYKIVTKDKSPKTVKVAEKKEVTTEAKD